MKQKRFSMGLVMTLLISLLVVPASATTFDDLTGRFAWVAPYAEDLSDLGIVKGYEDGLYHPDEQLTAIQALAFCARILQLDNTTKTAMVDKYGAFVTTLLPRGQVWAASEIIVCIGAGILTIDELRTMCTNNAIASPITKEDLAMYLVRTMQLEEQAQALTSYSMGYSDTSSISGTRKPYVYLLSQYNIVQGNDLNQFEPKSYVNRAVVAAMISRAYNTMISKPIAVDLPEYQDYDFVSGVVDSVTSNTNGTLTMVITSEVEGSMQVTMYTGTPIYLNRVGATVNDITPGYFAKVLLSSAGKPTAVYLDNSTYTYEGVVVTASDESITIVTNGITKTFTLDRCTEVKTGTKTGDSSIIDSNEAYEDAAIRATSSGRAVSVVFSGGTVQQEGLFSKVTYTTTGTVLTLSGRNCVETDYTITPAATVTINGVSGVLSNNYAGELVTLTIDSETGKILSVAVDTTSNIVQGYIRDITNTSTTRSISIRSFLTGTSKTYNLASSYTVTYQDQEIYFGNINKNDVATVELDSYGRVVRIDTYPGVVITEGTIESVEYGMITTLKVKRHDGVTVNFELNMENLPTFTRNGNTSTVDKLVTGDTVAVTVRWNYVLSVDSVGQETNAKGTISTITTGMDGTNISLVLTTGESATYTVANNVVISYNNSSMNLTSLKPGDSVAMVVVNNQVVSIDVLSVASSNSELTGTILNIDQNAGTIIFMRPNNTLVTIYAASATIISSNGSQIAFNSLKSGDNLTIYGAYSGAEFLASVIIRK